MTGEVNLHEFQEKSIQGFENSVQKGLYLVEDSVFGLYAGILSHFGTRVKSRYLGRCATVAFVENEIDRGQLAAMPILNSLKGTDDQVTNHGATATDFCEQAGLVYVEHWAGYSWMGDNEDSNKLSILMNVPYPSARFIDAFHAMAVMTTLADIQFYCWTPQDIAASLTPPSNVHWE